MPKPIGAVYRCTKAKGHTRSHYFFGPKPESVLCDQCGKGARAFFVRDLNLAANDGAHLKAHRRASKTP